jgi:hypothetical protein
MYIFSRRKVVINEKELDFDQLDEKHAIGRLALHRL